ncbi:MAG: alpha-ketoglutarate-dependent dioxygenase AlkB [Candidatus Eremiobacteraeota bacterium]|nr:alpha-ketoglutarate-dependent dioxygenase AlkB [Candidatus Eremiobacteraeota bacterium]
MAQQAGLFEERCRVLVDDWSGRIAYYPALFDSAQSARYFDVLQREISWAQEHMWMYDRTVEVPRLVASFLSGEALPGALTAMQTCVGELLGERFNSVGLNYYRRAGDSVAWHNDHAGELVAQPVIALVSLGCVREMRVRSKSRPRTTFSCDLEPGSVFVMSGRSQEFWEHHIPKCSRAIDARISVAFRQRPERLQKAIP